MVKRYVNWGGVVLAPGRLRSRWPVDLSGCSTHSTQIQLAHTSVHHSGPARAVRDTCEYAVSRQRTKSCIRAKASSRELPANRWPVNAPMRDTASAPLSGWFWAGLQPLRSHASSAMIRQTAEAVDRVHVMSVCKQCLRSFCATRATRLLAIEPESGRTSFRPATTEIFKSTRAEQGHRGLYESYHDATVAQVTSRSSSCRVRLS